jgi:hypothetical protein
MTKKLVIVAAFVLPLLPIAILIWASVQPTVGSAVRAEQLQPLSAAQLGQLPIGSDVLGEGTISTESIAQYRTFVAYIPERHFLDNDLGGYWSIGEAQAAPFILSLGDGPVRVSNSDYRLEKPTSLWWQPNNVGDYPMRYTGFALGDRVMVLGTVTNADHSPAIIAQVVYGGTQTDYLAAYEQTKIWLVISAGMLAILVMAVSVVVLISRQHRPHTISHAGI